MTRPRFGHLFRLGFGIAGGTAMLVALFTTWDRATEAILPSWSAVGWSLVAVTGGLVGAGRGWAALFDRRHAARLRSAFYVAQVGKYLPGGGLWQAVGQTEMSRSDGLPAARAAAGFVVHGVVQLVAGLALGSLSSFGAPGPAGVRVLLGGGLLAALLLRRDWLVHVLRWSSRIIPRGAAEFAPPEQPRILRSFAWALTAVLGSGLGFAFLLHGLAPGFPIPYAATAFSLAWAIGFAAVPFPSGLGVREAVLAFLLPGATAQVLAAAIALRLSLIVAELGFSAVSARRLGR